MTDPARLGQSGACPPKVRLVKRAKGYELRHDDGFQVATLSGIDAAKLLFQIKDELRRTKLGRDCLDTAHYQRSRQRAALPVGASGEHTPRGRNDA